MFKVVGLLWNDKNCQIISDSKNYYVLYGWNGEKYHSCWRVLDKRGYTRANDENTYIIEPIYDDENNLIDYNIADVIILKD
jgi:hypothetical protein